MGSGYKIIIADDEYFIRDGLMSFDWEGLGFIAAGSAQNGKKALELLERETADVLITDIKMPVMDGLELGRIVHDRYPSCKIVILTGYKDFEYARTAISAGAVDYLLKPVNRHDIEKLFLSLKEKLDREYSEKEQLDSYRKRLDKSRPLALEALARDIAEGKADSLEDIAGILDNLEVNFDRRCYSCAVIQLEVRQGDGSRPPHSRDLENAGDGTGPMHKLREALQRFACSDANLIFFFDKSHGTVMLVNFDPGRQSAQKELLNIVGKVCRAFEKALGDIKTGMGVGVGNVYPNCLSLSKSYGEALKSLDCRFAGENERILCFWDTCKDNVVTAGQYPYDIEEKLLDSVLEGRMDDCRSHLKVFWDDLAVTAAGRQKAYIRESLSQLFAILERKLNKLGISMVSILNMPPPFTDFLDDCKSMSKVRDETETMLVSVTQAVSQAAAEFEAENSLAVLKAKEYIRSNYNKKIALKDVADHVFLNPCYFSLLFKKETGMNFVEYVTGYRMEKARELLKRADLKVYEVGELVGYENTKYFTDIFKKAVAMSPREFRNKNNGKD